MLFFETLKHLLTVRAAYCNSSQPLSEHSKMQPRSTAAPDDIQMSTVFEALKRRAPWLILTSGVIGAATFAILSMMAPKYLSEAELAIVAQGSASAFTDTRSPSASPDLVTTRMDKEAINTHVKAMQSPELLEQIAAKLHLKDRPEFNSELGPVDTLGGILRLVGIGGPKNGESERDRVLSAFRSRLQVYSAKESRFIGVRVTSIDPQLAADVANGLAESYRASIAEQGVVEVDDQQDVLRGKISKLTPEVAAAETEVDRYRGEIDGFRGGAQNTGLNEQQMSELTGELTRAKAARGEAEARAKSAREMMKLGSADALPDVQKSPLIQNLVQQRVRIERQISEQSATLLPGHPRMRQLNADLAGLKVQLNGEVAKIVDSLDKEARVAQGREDSIEKSLADIKARVVTNAPEEAKLRQLEANAKAKRTELDNLQGRLESNRKKLDTRAQPVEAQIISKAQPDSVPIFPKKVQLSTLMAFATLMFGTAWTVAKTLFHSARGGGTVAARSRPNPSSMRAEPVLTAQPRPVAQSQPKPKVAPQSQSRPMPSSPVREEVEVPPLPMPPQAIVATETDMTALARRLKGARSTDNGHRTILTGETASIDASAEALELAKAIATDGQYVLVVDWSPSGEGFAGTAALDTSKGFNDLLRGEALFDEIIQRLPGSTVHAIASGRAFDDADHDIDPDKLNLILDALDEAYDQIIVAGCHDEARNLFETIEGRFDTGILVADPPRVPPILVEASGIFLGFEVSDIEIVRFERKLAVAEPANQHVAHAIEPRMPIARQA
jgi:polysaccharide biosynthesis transport protein